MWPVNLCHDFRYGKIMYNQLDQFIGRSLRLYGEYSQGEADIFGQIVKPGHIVVEAGANIGSHTIHLAQLAGDQGQVWAFEPQRLVFQLLAGNVFKVDKILEDGRKLALQIVSYNVLCKPKNAPFRFEGFEEIE